MTSKNVFEFQDYKQYLLHTEELRKSVMRGFRARLGEAARCNSPFVSQVMAGGAHFSLEQGLGISRYLALKPNETRYFLLLIEHNRAGTPDLRAYFKSQLDELKEKFLDIKDRVKKDVELDGEAQGTYYSHWYYAAIHMLVTIPHFRTVTKISHALHLPMITVKNVVAFLLAHNLLAEHAGELIPGSSYLHLDRQSPLIARHHSNWRLVAMQMLSDPRPENVHYSTVSTLSQKDAEDIRAKLVEVIEGYVQTVADSKEEAMWAFNLDFFNLLGLNV
jgi:uncharacterized protein (TIGR02147 family)